MTNHAGSQTLLLRFGEASPAEAQRLASALEKTLREVENLQLHRKRDEWDAQDFGATLVLVLGAPVVLKVAEKLGDWLKLHRQVSISIETPQGKIVAKNLTAKQAGGLAEKLGGLLSSS